jgi:hypothetical protein
MKRQFSAFVLVAGMIVQMSGNAFAGQQSGGEPSGGHPPSGMPSDSNGTNTNGTGQFGTNGSVIKGNGNNVKQDNTILNNTYQTNDDHSFSPSSSSASGATSGSNSGASSGSSSGSSSQSGSSATGGTSSAGSSSAGGNAGSNIKFGDSTSYSKYDGRHDSGIQAPGLSSSVNYTNTYVKQNNICGVSMIESGVTPLSKSFSLGVNIAFIGGGSVGSSSQKFTKEQLAMLSQHASAMSRVNAEQSMLMSSPTLARYYLAVALERDMLAQGYKADQAKADSKALAELATSGDWQAMVSQSIKNSAQLCSIYRQPNSEAAPTIFTPPTQPIPVIDVPIRVPATN